RFAASSSSTRPCPGSHASRGNLLLAASRPLRLPLALVLVPTLRVGASSSPLRGLFVFHSPLSWFPRFAWEPPPRRFAASSSSTSPSPTSLPSRYSRTPGTPPPAFPRRPR